ncbi:hypothetical protein F5B20DRAFT_191 [Whalleya microplaca]|nr:hypothetical protein F5B20DRAFT_191 [Whalleya microplaca]
MSATHCSSRQSGAWLFSDPYAYQYASIAEEEEDHHHLSHTPATTPRSLCTGARFELEGSSPTTSSDGERAELEGSSPDRSPVELEADNTHYARPRPRPRATSIAGGLDSRSSPSVLARNRFANVRVSRKYPHTHRRAESCALPEVVAPAPLAITKAKVTLPVEEKIAVVPELQHQQQQRQRQGQGKGQRLSVLTCDPGLMVVGEDMPPSDFDEILRNMGPMHKKGKSGSSYVRGSRYYDRYSTNFG